MCVLLVEDDFLIRDMLAEALRDFGYDVIEVARGDIALDIVEIPPKEFTVLVTDYHMPGNVNGIQVAAYIRKKAPSIPVIIISARPDIVEPELHSIPTYHLLQKPFLATTLVNLVQLVAGPPPSQRLSS